MKIGDEVEDRGQWDLKGEHDVNSAQSLNMPFHRMMQVGIQSAELCLSWFMLGGISYENMF